jgi:iron complex transport system substrate-binding protein
LAIRKLPFALLSIGVLVALVFAACGGDDDDATPTASASASTAAASPSAAATTAKTAYPVTVTDLLGRTVEIKQKPTVIVGLSPTAVEFVYAAGGTVVGRTTTVDYPEAAKAAKDVGNAYQPSLETILSLKPDLIVADSIVDSPASVRQPLEQSGVPVIFAGVDSYQSVIDGLTLMGKVFDAQAKTAQVAASVTKARDDAKAALAGKSVSALAIIADRDNTIYGAKENSYAGDIMKQLGITNPAAGQPDAGPFPGYTSLAPEKIVQYNPDYIFTISPAPAPAPKLSTVLPAIPAFKSLKAVTTPNHVVEAPIEILQAPGPRITDAFAAIVKAVTGTTP